MPSPASVAATHGTVSDPASPTAAPYPTMSPGDPQRGVPPIVSPRTSSNRNASQGPTAGDRSERSRRAGHTTEPANSARGITDGQQDRGDRQRSNGNTQVNGAGDDASRSRRRAAQSPPEALPHRPSGSRDHRTTNSTAVAQNRQGMAGTATSTPAELSREASEVLNRVVISQPEVDIERERERMAEAVPSSPSSQQQGPIGTLSIVGSEGIEDSGRGGSRSRQDYKSSSGKREKNSKFGDYYLGNTLGEGEFGKVKMGWKQEGGVQVSCNFSCD
jgi:protein-serine/threonine kinase